MKRVLFSMVLLMAVSFSFAQMKNVKEAKSMANDVKPNFKQAEQLIILKRRILLTHGTLLDLFRDVSTKSK
jgi:hypothetical protein